MQMNILPISLSSFLNKFIFQVGALDKEREPKASHIRIDEETILAAASIPGMGLDDDVYEKVNRDNLSNPMTNASAMLLMPEDLNTRRDVFFAIMLLQNCILDSLLR